MLQGGAAILNALSELELLPSGYDGEPADGEGWYALADCGVVEAGQRLYLAGTGATVVADRATFSMSGEVCHAFGSKADSVAEALRDGQAGGLGCDPGEGEDSDEEYARVSAAMRERLEIAGTVPTSLVPEPLPSGSRLTPRPPSGPPPSSVVVARGSAAAEMRLIATFIQKCKLEPTRTNFVVSRLSPQKRSWIMDNFEPLGGETGVGAVEDLKCFIQQVEDDCTWGEEIAASSAVTRQRRRTAAWGELVERTVWARVNAAVESSTVVGVYAVGKKGGRQRMVPDCR